LSGGKMLVDQYPGAQLGQEPQLLQLVKAGDLDFAIVSSANTATISPQAGVMSLHFLFRSPEHVMKSLADQRVYEAIRDMIDQTAQGIHAIGLGTQGVRSLYGKKEIRSVADLKGLKVRVQATATEDTMFPAYGAQTVHMPFGSVYTSLQTGVVDFGENSINVYFVKALRGGAGDLALRARGEQRHPLDQRPAVAKPQRRAAQVGHGSRPRRQHAGAEARLRAGESGAGEDPRDGRQGGRQG